MSKVDSNTVEQLDSLLRAGKGDEVRAALSKLELKDVPRDVRLELAGIGLRSDLPDFSVRALHPLVFPPKGAPSVATEKEKAEYGAGLMRLGAVNEGLAILESLDADANPRVYLHLAIGNINQWDYAKAAAFLQKAIAAPDLGDYLRLVCRVNLSAALVHERRFDEAQKLFLQLTGETQEASSVLYGNILKYQAEMRIEMHDIAGARQLLDVAEKNLEAFHRDNFYVQKWRAIAALVENKGSAESAARVHEIKDIARENGDWETLRDCDFYKAIHTHNLVTFFRLYFGTPYESYRQRILKLWNGPLELPETYSWILKRDEKMPELRLLFGEKSKKGEKLKEGQTMYRLLSILSSDFYRPFRLPSLHAQVFPEEHFNPDSSSAKMRVLISRLKQWLKENRYPMSITEKDQCYSLSGLSPCALIVPRERSAQNASEHALAALQAAFSGEFSAKQAAKLLQKSSDSVLDILKEGIEQGRLVRRGESRASKYSFRIQAASKKAA